MNNLYYIEDIFLEFMSLVSYGRINLQHYDRSAAFSFYENISTGNQLTENQAKYVLKILFKYRNVARAFIDYEDKLENPMWKNPFRVIDNSKKIWIEQSDDNQLYICLKFPYGFKEKFDTEIEYVSRSSTWDNNRKVRLLKFYNYNLIQLYEFAKDNGFEISDNFMDAVTQVEEVWQNSEQYEFSSTVENDKVVLINAEEDALEYFESKKTGNIQNDLFIAKSMGYRYNTKPKTMIEHIANQSGNKFWVKNQKEFIDLAYKLDGKVAIILDRNADSLEWVKELAVVLDNSTYDKSDFRVCFRSSNKTDPEFNEWVSENNFGGKIASAKFLIFQYKPAKWLFNEENDVIMLATNELVPPTNSQSRTLFDSHPCVIYVGEYKPVKKEEEIIEL